MSREQILDFLRQAGGFVSGEELSGRLGLSRAAVWKAVDSLRKAGYEIEARSGLGYCLRQAPDLLSRQEILAKLGESCFLGRALRCYDSIDSTNTCAKHLALEGAPDGTVLVADRQTGGRGRLNRSFQSPAGKGVYLSVLLRPALPPERLLPVTSMTAVAMCDAIEEVSGLRPGIKWSNDLVLNGRKLAGILTELALEGESGRVQSLVIGVGINVLQAAGEFDGEVAEMATSLLRESGRAVSRAALAAAEIGALERLYQDLLRGNIQPYLIRYRQDCVNLGKAVQLLRGDGSREEALALDVDGDFGLLVRHGDGREEVVRSGEVSVRGLYGYAE